MAVGKIVGVQHTCDVIAAAIEGMAHALQRDLAAHDHVRAATGDARHRNEGAGAAQHLGVRPGTGLAIHQRRFSHPERYAFAESLLKNGRSRAAPGNFGIDGIGTGFFFDTVALFGIVPAELYLGALVSQVRAPCHFNSSLPRTSVSSVAVRLFLVMK
jgi:hypothetical protein